jgi:uroporphyrinogen-III synthase
MRTLLITRSERDAGPLLSLLPHTITCLCAPLQQVVWSVPDLSIVPSGVVLTSRQAVQALAVSSLARETPVYVIGERTAQAVREAGFLQVFVPPLDLSSVASRAEALAAWIAWHTPEEGAWLYLSGERITCDIAAYLRSHGRNAQRVVAYRTEPVGLPDTIRMALERGDCREIVCYSAHQVACLAQTFPVSVWERLRAYAIGERTAAALRAVGVQDVEVAAEPTVEALAQRIAFPIDSQASSCIGL